VVVAKGTGAATALITGSTDGKMQLWDAQLQVGAALDLASLGGISRSVQSLQWDAPNHKILIGTWSAEIFEMHDSEGYDIHDGPLVQVSALKTPL
jgi:hypothetical protein